MFSSAVCIAYEMDHYWFLFAFIFNTKITSLVWKLTIALVKLFEWTEYVFNGLWRSKSEQLKLWYKTSANVDLY